MGSNILFSDALKNFLSKKNKWMKKLIKWAFKNILKIHLQVSYWLLIFSSFITDVLDFFFSFFFSLLLTWWFSFIIIFFFSFVWSLNAHSFLLFIFFDFFWMCSFPFFLFFFYFYFFCAHMFIFSLILVGFFFLLKHFVKLFFLNFFIL